MNMRILPGKLTGTVRVPVSKSLAHRALFLAAMADRATGICCPDLSEDIKASVRAVEMLGARVETEGDILTVTPADRDSVSSEVQTFDCGESGSTLRFVLPMAGVEGVMTEIMTRGRLGYRPLKEFGRELSKKGMAFDQIGYAVRALGKLRPGTFSLPGNISSQYISALLMALPLLEEPSEIIIEGALSSSAYVDLTLEMMAAFGAEPEKTEAGFRIDPVGSYRSPGEITIEGDWSAAAFWLAANAIGSDISLTGLNADSMQGDRAVIGFLDKIRDGEASIDIDQTPDLLPALAVVAAATPAVTRFVHAARLRDKESDRLNATAQMLEALGASCMVTDDELIVTGAAGGRLAGGKVDACGDHRIAMSAAIAAAVCEEPVEIIGAEAWAKSYPKFRDDFLALGGNIDA